MDMRFAALALTALVVASCGDSPSPKPAADVRRASTPVADPLSGPRHARNDCSRQSGANFPAAFADPDNLVVGPLVLVGGGAYTDPATVREFGGNKFPLLVRAGHTASIVIAADARPFARLGYGPLPQGETKLRDAYVSATFIACRPGRSDSSADGEEVTFWSGFVLARRPLCVPLDISVDGTPPRRVGLALGKRC
jgi:hypothetical protein